MNRGRFQLHGITPPPGKLGHSLPSAYKLTSLETAAQSVFGRHPAPIARKCLNMTLGEDKDKENVTNLAGHVADLRVDDGYGAPSPPPSPYIGTPSYPAVLDHIRRHRPQQDASMVSVDLPGSKRLQSRSPEIVTLEKFRGNGMNDVSFAQGFTRGSFVPTSDDPQRPASALSQSWRFHSFVGNAEIGVLFPTTIRNPNKALVTVDGDTKILIANEMACELFSYTHDRLVGMKLRELFASPFQEKQDSLIEEHIDSSGKRVMVNGKVVDAVDSMGTEFPVSMWMKKVVEEPETRCIVVLEPVERTTGLIYLDASGTVVSCDDKFIQLSGYPSKDEICGHPVTDFIPAFHLPTSSEKTKSKKEQQATGRTKDGVAFPLSLILRSLRGQKIIDGREATYKVLVWAFANISGLVSFQPGGKIIGINENYARLMFGYLATEVQGKDMTFLIPDFFHEVTDHLMDSGSIPLPPFESDDTLPPAHHVLQQRMSSGSLSLESISSSGKSTSSPGVRNSREEIRPETEIKPRDDSGVASAPPQQQQNNMQSEEGTTVTPKQKEKEVSFSDRIQVSSQNITPESESGMPTPETVTSTPSHPIQNASRLSHSPVPHTLTSRSQRSLSRSSSLTIIEGSYVGYGCHRDGSSLPIVFDVKSVDLDDGGQIYCVWVSRNLVEGGDGSRMQLDWTLGATFDASDRPPEASMSTAYTDGFDSLHQDSCPYITLGSPGTLEEVIACRGDYERTYDTLKSIGKGAFGFVKLAQKQSDKQMVVVKFIRKVRVLDECWIDVPGKGNMPLEIHLLTTLSHPHIVQVLDVFENEEFYQMVMEKHGDGMDLFEFIDRQPAIDEPMESHIFRQVVGAVAYLHSLNITHRDIKDENIIIDRRFMCKLIDFGSAAIMEKGKLFGTFCGTIEYCSPEVLLGNRYGGPELECWSLGVTLYTLAFGENPFFDLEESIQARFQPPFAVSAALTHLLMWLLHPEPRARATIRDMQEHRWLCQPVELNKYKWEIVVPPPMTGPGPLLQNESLMDTNTITEQRHLNECVLGEESEGITPIDSDEDHMESQYKQCLEDTELPTMNPNQSKETDSM